MKKIVGIKTNVELIRGFMKEKGFTVKDFCKFCNISQYAFYKFLRSEFSLRITIVYNIGKHMGISIDKLIVKNK